MRLVLTLACIFAACGFVVEGPRGGASDAIDRLERAPRWEATEGSLRDDDVRGLGGGLEYAIHDSVCALRFIDAPSCEEVHQEIAGALAVWGSGHPGLHFEDVTTRIQPAFPLSALGKRAQGAEIDFFGASPDDFPPFRAHLTTGYTMFYERPAERVRLTNGGRSRATARIESADVRFNAARCFYIDASAARRDCIHFPSLVLHEIGHTLGIAHPDEFRSDNLDNDDDPANRLDIDCRDPSIGLATSPAYNGAAVAVGRDVQGPGRARRGLTWDDVAARDALYPHCGIRTLERFGQAWGAFARAADGHSATVRNQSKPSAARARAMARCMRGGGQDCRVLASFNGCFAYAEGRGGTAGQAHAMRSDHARVDAVLACTRDGGTDCRVTTDFCAFD